MSRQGWGDGPVKKRLSTQACGPILKLSTWTMSVIRFSAAVREQRQEYLWPTGKLQVRQESLPPPQNVEHVRGGTSPGGQDTLRHQLLSTTQHKDLLPRRAWGEGEACVWVRRRQGPAAAGAFPWVFKEKRSLSCYVLIGHVSQVMNFDCWSVFCLRDELNSNSM